MSNFSLSYPLNRLSPTLFSFATDQASVYEINFAQFENIIIDTSDEIIEIENFQLIVYLVSGSEASTDAKLGVTVCSAVDIFSEKTIRVRFLMYVILLTIGRGPESENSISGTTNLALKPTSPKQM